MRAYLAGWYDIGGPDPVPLPLPPDVDDDSTVECRGYYEGRDDDVYCRYRAPLSDFAAAARGEAVEARDYSADHGAASPADDAADAEDADVVDVDFEPRLAATAVEVEETGPDRA